MRLKCTSPHLPTFVIALLATAVLHACRSDERLLAPAARIPGLTAQHQPPLGTFSAPIPPSNETGNNPVSTGIFVPQGVEVTVTVSGYLHYSPNPGRAACSSSPPVELPGGFNPVGPIGFPNTPGYIYTGHGAFLSHQMTDAFNPWAPLVQMQPREPSAETVSGRVTGPGYLWFNRLPGFPGACNSPETGYQPDWFVSGAQTVTVEAVDPSLGIDVVCTGSGAPRGSTISCQARPQPSTQTLAVTRWTFISSAAGDTVTRGTNVSDQTWVGQLVVDGRIDVTGTVAGHPATGTAGVTVTARDWTQKTVNHRVEEDVGNPLPPHPTQPADLGTHAPFAQAYVPANGYPQIQSGPNQGMFYFTEVPVEALSRIRINRVALSTGSDFYNLQPKNAPRGKCKRSDVVPFLPLAEDHEGLTLSPTSHAGVFRNELNRQVPQATEHVVALNNLALLLDRADTAAAPGIQAARNAARDQKDGGTVPPIPYCTFKYF